MSKKALNIKITAQPGYVLEQSDPAHQKFVWSYEITIQNDSEEIVQLLSRYWRITEMSGKVEEVHGLGVVGRQPLIKPERKFVYVSYCQLSTPQGTMEGYYDFQDLNEHHYEIQIPKFVLSAPSAITLQYKSKLH